MENPANAARSARSILTEVAVVVLGVEAVTLAVVLASMVWPAAAPYQGVVIAVAFLYAPVAADRWAGERPRPAPRGTAWRSLVCGLAAAVVVLPLFAAGNHLFQRHVKGRELSPGPWTEHLKDWPAEWEGRPAAQDGDLPRVWVDDGLLVLMNPPDGPVGARVVWSPAVDARRNQPAAATVEGELGEVGVATSSPAALPPGAALVFHARRVESFTLDGADEARVGATSARRDLSGEERPGWAWWLWMLASQVILIALPEEIFYRGYLQTRLRRIWPGGVPVLGAAVGPAIVITSVLFAAGHMVTIPAAFRLAVFFPSLLFGWLRDRTDHVAGPVVLHVLSNLAMLTVIRFYG